MSGQLALHGVLDFIRHEPAHHRVLYHAHPFNDRQGLPTGTAVAWNGPGCLFGFGRIRCMS